LDKNLGLFDMVQMHFKKDNLVKLYVLLFIGAAFALPFKAQIANGLLLGAILPGVFLWDRRFTIHPILAPIPLFLLVLFSMLWTKNQARGWSSIEQQSSLLLVPVAFYAGRQYFTQDIVKKVLIAFLVAMIIYLVGGYTRVHLDTGLWIFYREDLTIYNMHPGYLSTYVLVCFLIVWRFDFSRILQIVLSLILVVALIILSSKNQLITFSVILLGILIFYAKKNKGHLIALASILLVFIIFIANSPFILERFSNPKNHFRMKMIEVSFSIIKLHPLIGVGIGDRQDELDIRYPPMEEDWRLHGFNAHNQILDYCILGGVITALAYLLIFLIPILKYPNYFSFGFFLIVFSAALTESFLFRQAGLLLLLIFSGILSRSKN